MSRKEDSMKRVSFSAAVCFVLLTGAAAAQIATSHLAPGKDVAGPRSPEYARVQERLARGWNTWDVHSVATQVLLPEGLAIHVGMKHNSSLNGDAWLGDALIGSFGPDAPVVTPGLHAWDGSYTRADYEWKGHKWRVESAHDGDDLVMLVTPLESKSALPPTVVFSVDSEFGAGGVFGDGVVASYYISAATGKSQWVEVSFVCQSGPCKPRKAFQAERPDFAVDLRTAVGLSTQAFGGTTLPPARRPRTLDEIRM